MFRDTITRLFVALTGLLIMYLVYTKVMETRTEFVDNEWHLNGDAKEGNTLPDNVNAIRAFDYDAPCDIAKVITSLYDVSRPLTSSVLDELRGCLVLLFFRSPRCGTTAIYHLLTKLSRKLMYNSVFGCHINHQAHWVRHIDNLTTTRTPTVMSCHQVATDIITDPIKSPVIMNVIRHPVDHIASIFKMMKYGDRKELPSGTSAKGHDICNMTLGEYILDQGLSLPCIHTQFLALRFLCGDCDGCDSKPVCLQEAKKNLDKLYLFVGISENIPGFLLVMETLLPQFFHDALKEYVNMSGLYSLFSPDARNETMTSEALDYLNKELADDIELYHYVQQRSFIVIKKVIEYRANNAIEDNTYLRNREQCLVNKTCI